MLKSAGIGLAIIGLILCISVFIINSNNKEDISETTIIKQENTNSTISSSTSDSFIIDNFAGNRSLEQSITLTDEFKYFKILVNNTGDTDLKVGISTQTGVSVIPPGSFTIYNTGSWKQGNYTITFISGAGMNGNAACTLLAEPLN